MKRRRPFQNKQTIDWQPRISNIISGIGVLVSAFMFYFTWQLFNETQKSTDAAIRSANAAERAIRQQRSNDSITQINNVKSSYIDSVNLNTQINSHIERKKEFEIENKPSLQIIDGVIDSLKIGEHFGASFSIANFGKAPPMIIYGESAIFFAKKLQITPQTKFDRDVHTFTLQPKEWYQLNAYVNGSVINQELFNSVKTGRKDIFLVFRIVYYNTLAEQKRIISFVYQVSYKPLFKVNVEKPKDSLFE